MPNFKCTVVDAEGHYSLREIYAENKEEIAATFARGEEKLLICRRRWFKGFRLRKWFRNKIGYGEFLMFNQELITLLRGGIPFIRAIEIIIANTKSGHLQTMLKKSATDIRNGTQISDAFSSTEIPFDKIYRASLVAGEKSGHLESVLAKFNIYLAKISDLKRKTVNSLTYPVVLLVFMFAMVLVVTIFVIPKFSSFYESFQAQLPAITLFFIATANFLKENAILILVLLILVYSAIRLIEKYRPDIIIFDQLKTRVPFIGRIIHENAIAVFARTLSILVAGGIPVPESSVIAIETFSNRFYHSKVRHLPKHIQEGNILSNVLEGISIIPRIMVEMVRVGETSGNLSAVLDECADFYERSIDSKINTLISLIEPVIIITLGLVIALMLVSVYLPIFGTIRVVQ